jgi:hypothetical protein
VGWLSISGFAAVTSCRHHPLRPSRTAFKVAFVPIPRATKVVVGVVHDIGDVDEPRRGVWDLMFRVAWRFAGTRSTKEAERRQPVARRQQAERNVRRDERSVRASGWITNDRSLCKAHKPRNVLLIAHLTRSPAIAARVVLDTSA